MTISVKTGTNQVASVAQPYIKLSASQWTPLKRALTKTAGGWQEVWPNEFFYIHTGRGYNMNMHAAFGYPTAPSRYTFINNGEIGGTIDSLGWSLVSGAFPAGSTVTLINNGRIEGAGGRGASFASSGTGSAIDQARSGSNGLLLQTDVIIQNNGIIGGGGGGGGCTGDFAGSTRYNVAGGGGAGIPGGVGGIYDWGDHSPANTGGLDAGGTALYGNGHGGDLGVTGNTATVIVNDDYSMMAIGAPAGIAIGNTGYIVGGSYGLSSAGVKGRTIGGKNSVWTQYASMTGRGNWGDSLYVNLSLSKAGATVSGQWISGGATISVIKLSETQYQFTSTGALSPYTYNYWRDGVFRFTMTSGSETDYFDMYIRVGDKRKVSTVEHKSCFVAGSIVTMADGSLRAIETIDVGEWVRTAVGVAQVTELYLPTLGDRTLYAMEDGKCQTSGEHSLWSRDPASGEQWWATRDMVQWRDEAITGDGPNFNGHEPFDLTSAEGTSWDFATEEGWINTTWHAVPASPDTQLYHLLLDTGGSYFVDGYLVSSIADTGGVDWETFEWVPNVL